MSAQIALINGSLRHNSLNQILANRARAALESRGIVVTQLSIAEIPLFNGDIEFPAPEPVARLREEVGRAAGLWIVTPEYNGGVPGTLKNALDWLSRPLTEGAVGKPEIIQQKPVAISGAAGRSAASLVLEELAGLLGRLGLDLVEPVVGISMDASAFTDNVFELTDEDGARIDAQAESLIGSLR